jgi:hypothetical protein
VNTPNSASTKEWKEMSQALRISAVVPTMYTSSVGLADDPNTFTKEEDTAVLNENEQDTDES